MHAHKAAGIVAQAYQHVELLERFPRARAVATPNTVQVMRINASPEVLRNAWEAGFPGQIPVNLMIAEEIEGNVIRLEGHELVVVELGHTDTDHTTCLHVPSVGLVTSTSLFVSGHRIQPPGGGFHITKDFGGDADSFCQR